MFRLRSRRAILDPGLGTELGSEPSEPAASKLESAVRSKLEVCVASIALKDIARMLPDRPLPRRFRNYRLAALWGDPERTASAYNGRLRGLPDDVQSLYVDHKGRPWVDANYGIGLVYKGGLAALSMACVPEGGKDKTLRILQIQCVDQTEREPHQKTRNGLYGGFYWRDTLVRAWESVGQEVGATLEVRGARANPWCDVRNPEEFERFREAYDVPAARLDYMYDNTTHIWSQPPDRPENPPFRNPYWGFRDENLS